MPCVRSHALFADTQLPPWPRDRRPLDGPANDRGIAECRNPRTSASMAPHLKPRPTNMRALRAVEPEGKVTHAPERPARILCVDGVGDRRPNDRACTVVGIATGNAPGDRRERSGREGSEPSPVRGHDRRKGDHQNREAVHQSDDSIPSLLAKCLSGWWLRRRGRIHVSPQPLQHPRRPRELQHQVVQARRGGVHLAAPVRPAGRTDGSRRLAGRNGGALLRLRDRTPRAATSRTTDSSSRSDRRC